jgi:methionyl-tRNA formyltransferase
VSRAAFDVGAILMQRRTDIGDGERCGALKRRLADMGSGMVMETLAALPSLKQQQRPQDAAADAAVPAALLTAPKLDPRLSQIDFEAMPAETVVRRVRSLEDSHPAWALFAFGKPVGVPKRLMLLDATAVRLGDDQEAAALLARQPDGVKPGTLCFDAKARRLFVRCTDAWVELLSVHQEYKPRALSGFEFGNGYRMGQFAPDGGFTLFQLGATKDGAK